VVFRYVVFQPFPGEVLEGVIARSGPEGITVSMHFFQDVTVAVDKLPSPAKLFAKKNRY
jgi:DNA-directed RNA polymerase subunit E'/Rpb7